MKNNKLRAIYWIIGFFVMAFPINYAYHGTLIQGLINGILGIIVAILILIFGDKNIK